MIDRLRLKQTATDYFISLKQARSKIIRKLKSRDRVEFSNKRTKAYNFAEKVNGNSPVVMGMAKDYLDENDYPTHVALVPDGNRRFANDRGLTVGEGYAAGAEKIIQFREWAMVDNDVEYITAFLLSTENIKRRPKDELAQLYGVFTGFFNSVAENEAVQEAGIKHEVRGNEEAMSMLPDEVLESINHMESATEDLDQHTMVFTLGYGSRDDLARAARRTNDLAINGQITVSDDGEDNNEFRQNLMLGDLPDVDLMLRTSERRLSNYLLYSNAYAELVFLDKMWPAFSEGDFYASMYRYANRDRRFGV
jgi:undecaprenyl diphosphate synthase/tritrans,polycis-undecaprenyl-diphosphate synthase [geranylgeranyl-diphosphate specific]